MSRVQRRTVRFVSTIVALLMCSTAIAQQPDRYYVEPPESVEDLPLCNPDSTQRAGDIERLVASGTEEDYAVAAILSKTDFLSRPYYLIFQHVPDYPCIHGAPLDQSTAEILTQFRTAHPKSLTAWSLINAYCEAPISQYQHCVESQAKARRDYPEMTAQTEQMGPVPSACTLESNPAARDKLCSGGEAESWQRLDPDNLLPIVRLVDEATKDETDKRVKEQLLLAANAPVTSSRQVHLPHAVFSRELWPFTAETEKRAKADDPIWMLIPNVFWLAGLHTPWNGLFIACKEYPLHSPEYRDACMSIAQTLRESRDYLVLNSLGIALERTVFELEDNEEAVQALWQEREDLIELNICASDGYGKTLSNIEEWYDEVAAVGELHAISAQCEANRAREQ